MFRPSSQLSITYKQPPQQDADEQRLANMLQMITGPANKLQIDLLVEYIRQSNLKETELFDSNGSALTLTAIGKATINRFLEK